jgi:outer membrane receptor protein involved in Fe transport
MSTYLKQLFISKFFILFYILPSVFSFKINAQNIGSVYGIVVNDGPIEFANTFLISEKDSSKIIKSTVSDSLGQFELTDLPFDNYILKIQMIGYQPFQMNIQLGETDKTINVRTIRLIPDSKLLDGVEVVSHKDLITKTTQGFIINAKDNLTQAGGTATDLLRNTPTVVVDAEGAITIRGKSPLILINGRNSSLGATDRIPASSIESIEIINNPSAQYDADAEGGIINIKLKKNTAQGTNVSLGLGGGYGAHGRVNSSFIINHQSGKWNLGLAYDNRFAARTRKAEANRTNYDFPDEYYLIQKRFDNRLEQTQNLKFNIDYNPNDKNSFGLEAIGNMDGQDNDETLTSLFKTQTDSFNTKNSRESIEIGREKVAELALNYSRKFNDSRRKLAALISSSYNYETENTDITTKSLNASDAFVGDPFLQRTYNYQTSNVSNFKIDYVHPVTKNGVIETGYKGITRFTNANFQNQYFVNNEYVKNALASNIFNFREQIHAVYLQYRGYSGKIDSAKWKYDIGLRAEQVINHGEGISNNVNVSRRYFNIFPTANLVRYINTRDFAKLSYSRRINRPGLGQLNPFVDITDSLNQHGGNPYLLPELVNSLEAGYNKEWKKIMVSANLFYRYATNIIRTYIDLKSNGVALTLPVNYGSSTTYGIEGIMSVYPTTFWSANTSISFYQQNINGSNISADIANNVFSWYCKIINNFSLWKGSKLQLIANYNSPIGTPQGQKVAIYFADAGFQQKILKGKGGLGLVVTDLFNTQANGYSAYASNFSYSRKFKIDTRAILVTFAYSFGTSFKEELIENKFSND